MTTEQSRADSEFDQDTAIEQVDDDHWTTRLSTAWSIGSVPNGGYSSAPIVRALLARTGRPDPLSITAHFYRPTIGGMRATIETTEHRAGRTFANASAVLSQDDKERTRCTGVFGELPAASSGEVFTAPPPALPPPEQCPRREPGVQGIVLPLMDMIDVHLAPEAPEPGPDVPATIWGWVRFRDERSPDPLALTMFADAFPPSALVIDDKIGWVPTLELTIHLRQRPVDGWILASITSHDVQDRMLVEDVRLWDASGALVCQARQLAMRGQRQA